MTSVLTSDNVKAIASGTRKPVSEERRMRLLVLCGLALIIGVMTGLAQSYSGP